ncbi:MAG: hypothetical protein AAGD43_03410 [Pseudomonadota bacterium]
MQPTPAVLLLIALASLALPGCAALGIATDNLAVPAEVKAYARQVPRIEMTTKVPSKERLCEMQRQHAKQEAFLDGTIEESKRTYVAHCDLSKPKKAKDNKQTS